MNRLPELLREALEQIAKATLPELETIKVTYLGKKSELKELLRGLGKLSADDRPRFGAAVNEAAREIEERINARREHLENSGPAEGFDSTLPGFSRRLGLSHPIVSTIERVCGIFTRLGYGIAEGPDIEDDAHNFTDLNFPPDHPARDAQDTFFLNGGAGGSLLLRTHTSPVQIRIMKERMPPLAIIIPGRTYRADAADATHSPIFHQIEGLVVGENITMADLKGTLNTFARELFGPAFALRFRPSFFPFTEPSAEIDVSCVNCAGEANSGCRVCKGTGWLEVLGAGMVDPDVFEAVCRRRNDRVYDPEKVTGFAFGMGVERIAMLRHGIDDLRLFYENDPRFLAQFA